jgi:hypothetical protein
MATLTADIACERFHELRSAKAPWEQKMREVAEHIRPLRLEMNAVYKPETMPPQQNPYITSSTAHYALDTYVGNLYTYLSNEANEWFSLETYDADLNRWGRVKAWLAAVSRIVLNSYGPAMCGFYSQVPELYADMAGLGTSGFNSEWMPNRQEIFDICYSPFDLYYDLDNYYRVDTVYRPFWWSKRQILRQWPKAADDAGKMTRLKNAKDGEKFMVLHCLTANDEYTDGQIGPNGFPYSDLYFMLDEKHELQRGGRRYFFQTPRLAGNGPYGYGLGQRALPDIRTLNAMDRSMLENAEMINHPPPLMPDRNALQLTRPQPRKPIYGGMSMGGRPMVQYLETSGRISTTHEMMQARDEMVREGFFSSLLQLASRTGLAAVEFLSRDEEKMRRLGPLLVRQQREFLSPSVSQRFLMLWEAGQLPPPPPELAGRDLKIKYVSPMAHAQKSATAAASVRLVDSTIALAQIKPGAVDFIDEEDVIRSYQEGFGAPATNVRGADDVAAMRAQRQQAEQMQQALAMGQQGADIANKLGIQAVPRDGGKKAA